MYSFQTDIFGFPAKMKNSDTMTLTLVQFFSIIFDVQKLVQRICQSHQRKSVPRSYGLLSAGQFSNGAGPVRGIVTLRALAASNSAGPISSLIISNKEILYSKNPKRGAELGNGLKIAISAPHFGFLPLLGVSNPSRSDLDELYVNPKQTGTKFNAILISIFYLSIATQHVPPIRQGPTLTDFACIISREVDLFLSSLI